MDPEMVIGRLLIIYQQIMIVDPSNNGGING